MSRTSLALMALFVFASASLVSAGTDPGKTSFQSQSSDADAVLLHRRIHSVGNLYFKVGNDGKLGGQGELTQSDPENALIGHDARFEFPAGSHNEHFYQGSLWVGGIVGSDTLVSEALRGVSDQANEFSGFSRISNTYDSVTGCQTYDAVYFDTLVALGRPDDATQRPHKPLGLKVTQRSRAFATSPYNDFVLIEYVIQNVSSLLIDRAYIGIFADADVGPATDDDESGFLPNRGVAYAIDNDGDPPTPWIRSAFAMAPIQITPEPSDTSFNWWGNNYSDINWGPSRVDAEFGPAGTPVGDVSRYLMMSNREKDYDQIRSALDMTAEGWRYDADHADWLSDIADGIDTRLLLSFGPYALSPGDSLHLVLVMAAGDAIHSKQNDFASLFNPSNPTPFYRSLNFSLLLATIDRARMVYDLGFQLPGAPPTHISARLQSDCAARCEWTPAPFDGVSGYRIYRRSGVGDFEPIAELPPSSLGYTDPLLAYGPSYTYAVASLDQSGAAGGKSVSNSVRPGEQLEVPHLDVRSVHGEIHVVAEAVALPIGFSQPKFVNVYRRPEGSSTSVLIRQIPALLPRIIGGQGGGKIPQGEVEGASGNWPHYEVAPLTQFIDEDVQSGVRYYYAASITNSLGDEGERTSEHSALAMAMDKPGAILFHTGCLGTLDNCSAVRALYGPWAAARSYDTIHFNLSRPIGVRESVSSLAALSHYSSLVLVIESDPALFPALQGSLRAWLQSYWSAGGRVVIVARNAGQGGVPADMARSMAGVHAAHRDNWTFSCTGGSICGISRFEGAHSMDSEYPDLDADSAKVWSDPKLQELVPYLGGDSHLGGDVPSVGYLDSLSEGTDVVYTFLSDQPDTSFFEGRTVGVRRITDSGSAILFAFPLSLMQYDQAWNALSVAVDDLGGDTTWTGQTAEQEEVDQILRWLYKSAAVAPNPEWDVSGDGRIDIRDVVRIIDKTKRAP